MQAAEGVYWGVREGRGPEGGDLRGAGADVEQ